MLVFDEGPEFIGLRAFDSVRQGEPFLVLRCTHWVPAEINFVAASTAELVFPAPGIGDALDGKPRFVSYNDTAPIRVVASGDWVIYHGGSSYSY